MKKRDIFIIIAIVALALIASSIFYTNNKANSQLMVRVSQNGQILRTLPLDQAYTETLNSELGSNTLVIENNTAIIQNADCDNQVCVHSPSINTPGETIACLPHKLILEIIQD